jgi:hypothetical protein
MSLPVLNNDILRLKIAVDQNPWQTGKAFCDFTQTGKRCQLLVF